MPYGDITIDDLLLDIPECDDVLLDIPECDALLFDGIVSVSGIIIDVDGVPTEYPYLLTEAGDFLITESGDRLIL